MYNVSKCGKVIWWNISSDHSLGTKTQPCFVNHKKKELKVTKLVALRCSSKFWNVDAVDGTTPSQLLSKIQEIFWWKWACFPKFDLFWCSGSVSTNAKGLCVEPRGLTLCRFSALIQQNVQNMAILGMESRFSFLQLCLRCAAAVCPTVNTIREPRKEVSRTTFFLCLETFSCPACSIAFAHHWSERALSKQTPDAVYFLSVPVIQFCHTYLKMCLFSVLYFVILHFLFFLIICLRVCFGWSPSQSWLCGCTAASLTAFDTVGSRSSPPSPAVTACMSRGKVTPLRIHAQSSPCDGWRFVL